MQSGLKVYGEGEWKVKSMELMASVEPMQPILRLMALLFKSMELNQEATIWSATPINRRSLMPKPVTNNQLDAVHKALINRGSLTFKIDEEAIAEWKQNKQGKRGRPCQFSDLAITTALMVKRIFYAPLRALQGFLDSVFKLANIPLSVRTPPVCHRAKEVEVSFKTKNQRW